MSRCKSIEGYEGKYLIYDDGRVYSQIRKNRLKGMFLKPTETHDGYFTVHLSDKRGGKQKILKVSRLVALHFIPNPENKPCVNHKDGNKEDNTFTNLEWNTVSANNYHKFRVLGYKITIRQRNRVREIGIKSRKLSMTQAKEIRAKYKNRRITLKKIAQNYNVSFGIIQRITSNKGYLEEGYNV